MSRKAKELDARYVADCYLAGESAQQLRKRLGVRDSRIIQLIGEAGVTYIPRRLPLDSPEIVRRYLSGESQKAIAAGLGCSVPAVFRRLQEAGVTMRPVAECIRLGMALQTPEKRFAMTDPAHRAVKGMTRTEEDLCQRAATRERLCQHVGRGELLFADMLLARGYATTVQKAVGRYNLDVALHAAPVAVEIFGGHWGGEGRVKARRQKRLNYLLDLGWSVIFIWGLRNYPIDSGAADQVIAEVERRRCDETAHPQELVIRGDGQPTAIRERKRH